MFLMFIYSILSKIVIRIEPTRGLDSKASIDPVVLIAIPYVS